MYKSPKDHPISRLHNLGFNISLNTDNRLMSNTSIDNELNVAKAAGIENPTSLLKYSASDSFLNQHFIIIIKKVIKLRFIN